MFIYSENAIFISMRLTIPVTAMKLSSTEFCRTLFLKKSSSLYSCYVLVIRIHCKHFGVSYDTFKDMLQNRIQDSRFKVYSLKHITAHRDYNIYTCK